MSNPPSRPTGTVTFLFTDIEGSTRLWEQHAEKMKPAHERQEAILLEAIRANGGYPYKMIGDAFQAAFQTAPQALRAALDAQRSLSSEQWSNDIGEVRVRMALHTGITDEREGDYFGPLLNRIARLMSIGHGGQVLISHATHELLRDHPTDGAMLRDLGEHRLKDLISPEHVFQLVAQDLPSDFPALKSLNNRPTNLPVQPNPLIGREKEIAAIRAKLLDDKVRLLTLTGPGGTGKTRLGLQVAADLLDNFKDGAFFVNLAPITDPTLVVSEIAKTLGLREAPKQTLLETVKSYLIDKKMHLVLDNFEHVSQAAPTISELMSVAPHLKFLVTSRARLQLQGEYEYQVPPLTTPNQKHLPSLEKLKEYEAVQLFVDRAKALKSDFELTRENAHSVAEICLRLDGLPLAIELAAARIKILTPQVILERLQSRLKLLTGGAKDLPTRQQALRSTIEWSHDLLIEREKQLFRRLAVFRGGRTLEAAEAVCVPQGNSSANSANTVPFLEIDVLDGITSLTDKSLMYTVEGTGGESRYWMLETIQEYAWEKLEESAEAEVLQMQHALYFMAVAEKAEPELRGAQQTEWLARLEDEHDNLRAALRWATERKQLIHSGGSIGSRGTRDSMPGNVEGAIIGLRIAGAIGRFWNVRGHYSEGREQLTRALTRSSNMILPEPAMTLPGLLGDNSDPTVQSQMQHSLGTYRAKALNAAGILTQQQGDYATARSLFEEGLTLARESGDTWGIAYALSNLGSLARDQGDYANARSLHEESLALSRELGDKWGISAALNNLGFVFNSQGDYANARSLHEESLALSRELGDKRAISSSLNNLGNVALSQGDYATARLLYLESLAFSRELGDKERIAQLLGNIGLLAITQGDYVIARSLNEESVALFREMGDKMGLSISMGNLGNVAHALGDYTTARLLYEETLVLQQELGDRWGIALSLNNMALIDTEEGDYATAHSLIEEGLILVREIGDKEGIAYSLGNLGNVANEEGEYDTARSLYEESLTLRIELGDRKGIVHSLAGLGTVGVTRIGIPGGTNSAGAVDDTEHRNAEWRARLLGAVEALLETLGAVLDIDISHPYERSITYSRAQLGEEAFKKAWEEGRAMSMEEAIAYALEES